MTINIVSILAETGNLLNNSFFVFEVANLFSLMISSNTSVARLSPARDTLVVLNTPARTDAVDFTVALRAAFVVAARDTPAADTTGLVADRPMRFKAFVTFCRMALRLTLLVLLVAARAVRAVTLDDAARD